MLRGQLYRTEERTAMCGTLRQTTLFTSATFFCKKVVDVGDEPRPAPNLSEKQTTTGNYRLQDSVFVVSDSSGGTYIPRTAGVLKNSQPYR